MGRPPSSKAHEQVLDAATSLFAEHGIDATSMDAIAAAAHVSKATIYKHWPDKPALCLAVLAHLHGRDPLPPARRSRDVRGDVIAFLDREPALPRTELRARIMPHLIAYAARTPAFGEAWRRRVIDPPRAQLTALLQRAIDEGQLPPDLDIEAAVPMLLGPVMYRNMLRASGEDAPADLVERIVSLLWRAASSGSKMGNGKW
jgi:AcrR family transcriptional regulator